MADIRFTAFVQGHNQQRGTGKDPELRFTNSGKPVLSFNTSESHSKKNNQGGYDTTGYTFRRVTVWGEDAERFQSLKDGDLIEVVGREETRSFDKQDGSKGYSLEVTADFVRVKPRKNQQGGQAQGGYQQGGQQNQRPAQGGYQQGQQGQADPWGQQAGGNYNWTSHRKAHRKATTSHLFRPLA